MRIREPRHGTVINQSQTETANASTTGGGTGLRSHLVRQNRVKQLSTLHGKWGLQFGLLSSLGS